MSENTRWWHTWHGHLAEQQPGEGQTCLTITLGPTRHSPDSLGDDDKGVPIKERTFPMALVDPDKPGPEAVYFGSFTHEPDEEETAHVDCQEDQ